MQIDRIRPHEKEYHPYMLYHIQSIGQIPLEEFKDIIPNVQYKKALMRKKDTWYSLTKDVMIDYLYNINLVLSYLLILDFCINIISILGCSQLVTTCFFSTTTDICCY